MLRLEAEFCGAVVEVWRPKRKRHLEFVGGTVGRLCPIVIRFRGSQRRAIREREKLERYGYKAKLKRERSTPSPADASQSAGSDVSQ